MKVANLIKHITLFVFTATVLVACKGTSKNGKALSNDENSNVKVIAVDPSLFLTDNEAVTITKVPCTLSDGTITDCYKIVTKSMPSDHEMGPWCPENISDGPEAGGIWLENGEVYDVDGDFIKNMATFYKDDNWMMYDSNGDIFVTKTLEDCANAANPNVGAEYENFCVECLPTYVTDITREYVIPETPIKQANPLRLDQLGPPRRGGGGADGSPKGERPAGGPPHEGSAAPSNRGIAFNGVVFDAPAPTDAILGAYTLAPFDDAGGHINLHAGYHYHAATGVSTKIEQKDLHAPQIGYAMDGFGMYAQLDSEGHEPTDLDECRGHYDSVRGYHYHVAAPGTNSFINCLSGAYAL